MSYIKRITAMMLSVMIAFMFIPTFSYAETEEPSSEDTITLRGIQSDQDVIASGECGESATWILTGTADDMVLHINGSGPMDDFNDGSPWRNYGEAIHEVVIENGITEIGLLAFDNCNFRTTEIPASVKTLRAWSFYNSNIESITIPSTVETISGAFYNCRNLNEVILPDTPIRLGQGTFENCVSLESIVLPEGITNLGGDFNNCTSLKEIVIPNGVKELGTHTFYNCSSLTSVILPSSLVKINEFAFYLCESLESITVPEKTRTIENYAFGSCDSLSRIEIPDSVTTIGDYAFNDCDNVCIYCYKDSCAHDFASTWDYDYKLWTDISTCTITNLDEEYTYTGSEIRPSIIVMDGENQLEENSQYVVSYDDNTEVGTASLTVTGLDNYTGSITRSFSIRNADGEGTEGIIDSGTCGVNGDNLTWELDNDGLLTISGEGDMQSYYEHAPWFAYASNINEASIGSGVTSIGDNAFRDCSSMTDISIPDSVISIGRSAFSSCNSLTSITFPEGVTSISDDAFSACSSLTSITVPDSVTNIGNCAFGTDSSTTLYVIPGSAAASYPYCTKVYLCDEYNVMDHYLGFSTESILMQSGGYFKLADYIITDMDLDNCTVVISDEDVCEYIDGEVINWESGTCNITISNGEYSAIATIVAQDTPATAIEVLSFHLPNLNLHKGESIVNALSVSPQNSDTSNILWTSSDTSVATVENGRIKAVGSGTAIIKAYASSGSSIIAECSVTVTSPLYDIIVLEESISLDVGSTRNLPFYRYPADTKDEINFCSDNTDVAIVDANGKVTAINCGTANITISSGDICKTINVIVESKLISISIDKASAQLRALGETIKLNVIYDPEDATNKEVVWSSDNETVATVDQNGLVTACGKGRAVIKVTTPDGNLEAACTITSKGEPGRISSANLALQNDITVKFYATFTEEPTEVSMAVTMNGNTTEIDGTKQAEGRYAFRYDDINPKYICDSISAVMTYKVNGKTYTNAIEDYSIKQYCMNILNKHTAASLNLTEEKYNELKTLVVDTLYLGAETQNYTGYKTDDLATKDLTEEQCELASTYSSPADGEKGYFAAPVSGTQLEDYKWVSGKVIMNNAFKIRLTFDAADTSDLEITAGGRTFTSEDFTQASEGRYYIQLDGISADAFRNNLAASFNKGGATLNYNINTYAVRTSSDSAAGELAKRLFNYGESSYSYTH